MNKKILLLNPPYKNNRIIREYNCSHTSKSLYTLPPIDLLEISGILAKEYEVSLIDSIADSLGYKEAYRRTINANPRAIVALTSVLSLDDDMALLKELKEKINCKIILMGDITYFRPKMIMERFPFVDCIVLDFTSDFILNYLRGDYVGLKDLIYRENRKIVFTGKSSLKTYKLPLPLHGIFPLKKYNPPYGRYKPFSSILSSYGCPYKCSFCVSGKMSYKERDINNFMEELKHLKKIGVKEVFVRDSAFNGNLKRSKEICRRMVKEGLVLAWTCEMTAINCDTELISLMKRAGCYLVMVGIETIDDNTLKDIRKPLNSSITANFFKICKKVGMLSLGHFIIGLPNEKEESIKRTIEFAKKSGCDYASFNLYVPRVGSDLRDDLVKNKMLRKEDLKNLDCSRNCVEITLPKEKLIKLKDKAIRDFYFTPSNIFKQIYLTRTWVQFLNLIKNGSQVMLDYFRK